MLRILFKKQYQIESLIYQYLGHLHTCKEHYAAAMEIFLDEGICGDFDFETTQTHKFESKADDVREEINALMYSKALLPESRGDIMNLLETLDQILGLFEQHLFMIKTQSLTIPDFIKLDTKELLALSLESCDLGIKQVRALFTRSDELKALVSTIDHNESHCDHIERRIITKIFGSDLDPFLKLQLKEMILNMGQIPDQIDRISKRILIISLKRRV